MQLSKFASSQPHAAYSVVIHGLSSHWTFLSRTLSSFLIPLEKAIRLHLLPKLCLHPPNDAMLALPIHSGGLGLSNPCQSSEDSYHFSISVTSPMAAAIINQLSFDCTIFHRQCDLKQEVLSISYQPGGSTLLTSKLEGQLKVRRQGGGQGGKAVSKSGYPPCPWNVMVFPFIRVIFVMLSLSCMVGHLRIFPPTVFVACFCCKLRF